MNRVLSEVTRGGYIECVHTGDIAIVNSRGRLIYFTGDPYRRTFFRSAAKPIQTLEVFRSGAYNKFKFTNRELSIMCASHYGERDHIEVVKGILNKIGDTSDDLQCGDAYSMSTPIKDEQLKSGIEANPLLSCCSGKHAGMLAICTSLNLNKDRYFDVNHPLQKNILKLISSVGEVSISDIGIGIDGCGVPVFEMPLYNMALSYSKLASNISTKYRKELDIIYDAMCKEPFMLSGTNGFCSDLTRVSNGKLVGKLGADGVYCIGSREKGIGIALKVDSGDVRPIPPIIMGILKDLKLLSLEELNKLKKYKVLDNKNFLGNTIGSISTTAKLEPYL